MKLKTIRAEWLNAGDYDEPLLRELLKYDMDCAKSVEFVRRDNREVIFKMQPATLHWSRVWEWPYAVNSVPLRWDQKVLNAGGGHSTMTCALAARCGTVFLADTAEESLEHVRTKPPFNRFIIHTRKWDITDLREVSDGAFDTVYCISVLEHVPEYMKALREMTRVLKVGGHLVLTCDVPITMPPEYKGEPKDCKSWNLTEYGLEILRYLDAFPKPDYAVIGYLKGEHMMVLMAVARKES